MSLVGNLEDLSLGDILQIISLSQKSGVLALSSDHGSGRIVFRSGLVQAACLKGGANDLRQLLVGGGFIDSASYDSSLARSRDLGVDVEETLASDAGLDADRIDGLIKESVEAAILEMFTWPAGDFSFDVRNEMDPEDPHLIIPNGLNAQYLAMEGLRLSDERARDHVDPDAETQPGLDVSLEDPLFGSDLLEAEPLDGEEDGDDHELYFGADAIEDGPEETLETEDPALDLEPIGSLDLDLGGPPASEPVSSPDAAAPPPVQPAGPAATPEPDRVAATETLVARTIEGTEGQEALEADLAEAADPAESSPVVESTPPTPPMSPRAETQSSPARRSTDVPQSLSLARKMPVVLIDPDVTILEWTKGAIEADFARVHVFQQAEQGLARIRQYLIRGQVPLVLVSAETQIDPLSGIHGLGDFVKRLKAQSPRLIVLGLREDDDEGPSTMPASLDGVLRRPARFQLAERSGAEGEAAGKILARALLEILAQDLSPEPEPEPSSPPVSESVEAPTSGTPEVACPALREATNQLQEASSRGEILPVVLEFAAQIFERVAILIVRDDDVFAIAGRGIPNLEVDPLSSTESSVTLESIGPGLIRQVLETNQAFVGTATTPADAQLLECFGTARPESIYLSPIESGSSVNVLLFADRGDTGHGLPDTSSLEVVLQHAGLALDRAALERALWEADADSR